MYFMNHKFLKIGLTAILCLICMNAFATGRDPEHSVICFTSGIVSGLDKLELVGVIAHELSHIGNYDIRLMSVVSVLVGTLTLLADWFTRGMFYGGRRRSRSQGSGPLIIIGIAMAIAIAKYFNSLDFFIKFK